MKKSLACKAIQSLCVVTLVSVWLGSAAVADPIGMVVDNSGGRVHVFDAGSDTVLATLNLPSNGSDGDCSITADGTRGFATTFTSQLHIIDLTTPSSPSLITSAGISNFGEDTSISPDQKFVVVADGSANQPLSVVDIALQSQISIFNVSGSHNAVEVLSDGTVLSAHFGQGRVYKLTIDGAGNLSNTGLILSGVFSVMNAYGDPTATAGFAVRFTNPGITSFLVGPMTAVDSRTLPGVANSGAMHPAGDKIYVRTTNGFVVAYSFNSVTGALGASPLFTVSVANSAAFFGMDQLAVTPDGSKLYVSSGSSLKVFDANNGTLLTTITNFGAGSLTGVCFTPQTQKIEKLLLGGPDEIGIYLPEPTAYFFEIAYTGPAALVVDTAPAEFECVNPLAPSAGTATCSKTGKSSKSANRIEWNVPAGSNTLVVEIQTVASPGKGHNAPVFKPTSCGPLPINDGATALEVDENGELVLVEVVDPVTGEVTLEPVVIVGPSNSLQVEAVDGAKPCIEEEEEEEEEEEDEAGEGDEGEGTGP